MDSEIENMLETFDQRPDLQGLGLLSELGQKMESISLEVKKMEEALAERKKALHEIRVGKIPELMVELGLSSLTLKSGATLGIKRQISCKFFPATKMKAITWLDENGFTEIVRREVAVSFDKGQEVIASTAVEVLTKAGFTPSVILDVHPMTLRAWGAAQDREHQNIPGELFDSTFFDIAEVKHG